LRLVATGNVKCISTDWIKRRIIKVRPLQVYYHRYLIHVSSTITTKPVVSGTARKFYHNTCLLSSQSFLSTCSHRFQPRIVSEPILGSLQDHILNQSQSAVRLMYAESFRRYFCLQGVRAAIRSQPLAKSRPLGVTNTVMNLTTTLRSAPSQWNSYCSKP
jgi:hypothetical protein